MRSYFVYILKCSDNSYYTGFTNNLERRFAEHSSGKNKDCYTFDKRPLELVWFETFNDVLDAIAIEKKIKGWTRRKKKPSLMRIGTNWFYTQKTILNSVNLHQQNKKLCRWYFLLKECLRQAQTDNILFNYNPLKYN